MALGDYLVSAREKANIFFNCKKACGDCSWSEKFEPVPGWTAKKVMLKTGTSGKKPRWVETYYITACPEFETDQPRKTSNLEMSDKDFAKVNWGDILND